jgi:hypothetical protein
MSNDTSVNSKNGLENIRWDGIFILYELIQYLSNIEFIEISSLNKLLRKKLKHKAFYKINLYSEFLFKFPTYFYSDEFEVENEAGDELVAIKSFQRKRINPFIKDLVNGFNSFNLHFKHISFDRLGRAAYFIFPIISKFNHLTSLSINECDISLKGFNKLMLKLCKLEYLSLKVVNLVILEEERPLNAVNLLPKTLKELQLGCIYLSKALNNNNPYKYLFNDESESLDTEYQTSTKRLPNLKKLKLTDHNCFEYRYMAKLLRTNRQLTHITLSCYYLSAEIVRPLRDSRNINEVTIILNSDSDSFYRNLNLKPLTSVNSLSITQIASNQHRKVNNIVKLCPKSTKLHISMDCYYSELIEQILEKLDQLKDLELEVKDFTFDEFDLSIFSNIETLKLDIGYKKAFTYKLPLQICKLKLIKVVPNNFYEIFNIMLEGCSDSAIWDIKVLDNVIEWRAKQVQNTTLL